MMMVTEKKWETIDDIVNMLLDESYPHRLKLQFLDDLYEKNLTDVFGKVNKRFSFLGGIQSSSHVNEKIKSIFEKINKYPKTDMSHETKLVIQSLEICQEKNIDQICEMLIDDNLSYQIKKDFIDKVFANSQLLDSNGVLLPRFNFLKEHKKFSIENGKVNPKAIKKQMCKIVKFLNKRDKYKKLNDDEESLLIDIQVNLFFFDSSSSVVLKFIRSLEKFCT